MVTKRRIFISFDHADTAQVNGFLGLRNITDSFDFFNHKLDHRIQSRDAEYVRRVIREDYIRPASVTRCNDRKHDLRKHLGEVGDRREFAPGQGDTWHPAPREFWNGPSRHPCEPCRKLATG